MFFIDMVLLCLFEPAAGHSFMSKYVCRVFLLILALSCRSALCQENVRRYEFSLHVEKNVELLQGDFSADGKYFVAGGSCGTGRVGKKGIVVIWDFNSEKKVFVENRLPKVCGSFCFAGTSNQVAFSCGDWSMFFCKYQEVRRRVFAWQLSNRIAPVVERNDQMMLFNVLKFSPDDRCLVGTCGELYGPNMLNKSVLRVWSTDGTDEKGRIVNVESGQVRDIVFLNNSEVLVAAQSYRDANAGVVLRVDLEAGGSSGLHEYLGDLKFSAFDGGQLGISSDRKKFAILQVDKITLCDLSGQEVRNIVMDKDFVGYDMEVSPNGRYVAVCTSFSKPVRIYDWKTGALLSEFSNGYVGDLAFSSDSRYLACVGKKSVFFVEVESVMMRK